MFMSPMGLGTKNQFSGDVQQQFSSQSGNTYTVKITTRHTDRYKWTETQHTNADTHKDAYTVIQILVYTWTKTHIHKHTI
jgi:putative salt-induced outer membrane protein YdiY